MNLKTRSTFLLAILICVGIFRTVGYGDELYAWGDSTTEVVSELPSGRDFVKVAAQGGAEYGWALALRSDGTIVAWGVEYEGRIANAPTEDGFVDVGATEIGGVALRSDGTIAYWGRTPNVPPPTGNDFVAIYAGRAHILALRSDGTIAAWGDHIKQNITGTPTDGPYVVITTGRDESLAMKNDGTIVAWGTSVDRLPDAPTDGDFVSLALGFDTAVGIKPDGSLVGWGAESELLSEIPSGTGFAAVKFGASTAIGLKTDGTLVSWGYDSQISTVPSGSHFTAISPDFEEDAFVIALVAVGPQEDIEDVIDLVDELAALGAVLPGDGSSLRSKLNSAINALPEDPDGAIGSLRAFINQVRAFVRTGRLTAAEGQELIDAAQAIIDELSN